ncbi:hypothetical protein F4778DRAFT_348926 [Xylariomycetidae sp. FL2044]|nr:hypothetical protein F4778DRAFT_348926 [Xylariomycetidae sp. FL2044]
MAASQGKAVIVAALIEGGCDVHVVSRFPRRLPSNIQQALTNLSPELYFNWEADEGVERRDDYIVTQDQNHSPFSVDAFGLAILWGRDATANLLLNHHVKSTSLRQRIIPHLHLAAVSGMPAIVLELLQRGEDANEICHQFHDCTPLHLAATNQKAMAQCLEHLVRFGANIRAEDSLRREPVTWAMHHAVPKHVLWFIEHGLKPLSYILFAPNHRKFLMDQCAKNDMFWECTKHMQALCMTGRARDLNILDFHEHIYERSIELKFTAADTLQKALGRAKRLKGGGRQRSLAGKITRP